VGENEVTDNLVEVARGVKEDTWKVIESIIITNIREAVFDNDPCDIFTLFE